MAIAPPPFYAVIDMTDPALAGLYQSFGSRTPAVLPLQTSTEGFPFSFRIVSPTGSTSPWQDVTSTNAVVQANVAQPGLPPVAGTNSFTLGTDGVTWSGTLLLGTPGMQTAFNYLNTAFISLSLQMDVQFAGESYFQTIYAGTLKVSRSVLSAGVVAATPIIAEPNLGEPTSDSSLLVSTAAGVRSWLATTAFGRGLLSVTNASLFYAANPVVDARLPLIAVDVSQPANPSYMAGAMQAALNAVPSGGARVYLRGGTYNFGNNLMGCNNPVVLCGDGPGSVSDPTGPGAANGAGYATGGTTLYSSSVGGDFITFQANGSSVSDLAFINSAGLPTPILNPGPYPTAGTGLQFYRCTNAHVTRTVVAGFWNNYHFQNGYGWTMTDSNCFAAFNFGVLDEDIAVPDGGDPAIHGCTFNNGPGGIAIIVRSGGGLKLSANKFNGWARHVNLQVALSTSDLIITGNSFENANDVSIALDKQVGADTATFENVLITGNQFAANTNCIQVLHQGIHRVVIGSNYLRCTATAIYISAGDEIHVLPNVIEAVNAILIAEPTAPETAATNIHIDRQQILGTINIYDATASPTAPGAMIAYGETKPLPAITTSPLQIVGWSGPTYSAGRVTIFAQGILSGVGTFAIRAERVFSRDTGVYSYATVGSDIVAGSAASSLVYTFGNGNFQLSSTTGGAVVGTCRVDLDGPLNAYAR